MQVPTLVSVSVSPTSVTSGTASTGTITVYGEGYTFIGLSSSNPAVQVPSSVAVGGSATTTFSITTSAVSSPVTATITATETFAQNPPRSPIVQTATLTVNPSTGISLNLVAAVNNQASLSWSGVAGAASYNVKRSTTNGSGYTTIANVTSLSYVNQGLTNGTPYYYIVTAMSGATESTPSNQVAATPTAQAFGFLNVGNGSSLSGSQPVQVSMASSNHGDEQNLVHFQVDGQYYEDGGEFQSPVSGGTTVTTSFVLDTQQYANGSHTITITDGINTSTINVVFNNNLSVVNVVNMFDPSGGNSEPTTATISAVLASTSSWTVSIYTTDNSKTLVKSWSGNSNTISLNWDGTNSTGSQMPGDAYEVDIAVGTSPSAQAATASPNDQGLNNVYQSAINLIAGSDVFLWLDQDVFPQGYSSMMAYAHAIKADLAPSKGNVWNTMSMLIHTPHYRYRAADIAAINQHFSSPLTVFYFYGHGGLGLGGDKQFSCGNSFWHSGLPDSSWTAPYDSSIQQLTQNVGYGTYVNAPALVFIDACKSGGDGNVYEQDDITFGNDFDIADVANVPGGAYLGWAGCAIQYGALAPPKDDWTFWRLDLWANFTNPNQTYDKDWSNLQRDLSNHGRNTGTEPDAQQVIDWYSNTGF